MYTTIASETPEVGMGVTMVVGSDCYPYSIIAVRSANRIVVQADDYRAARVHNYGEDVPYEYTANPQGSTQLLSLRKDGYWRGIGVENYPSFRIGKRRYYRDPHI